MQERIQEEADASQRAMRSVLAKEEAERLARKNEEFVRKRQAAKEAQAQAALARDKRLDHLRSKVVVHVHADPARLLHPTRASISKTSSPARTPQELAQASFSTVTMPHR
ncbi:hypothetical protein HKX48_001010 [Thoreauomyces humboldtii]|nr:hypothetical protein HKX48_001010 [Thoreauomyces humboldtii]